MSDEKEIEYYPYPVPSRFKTEQDFRNGLIEFNEIRWKMDAEELNEWIEMIVEDYWKE